MKKAFLWAVVVSAGVALGQEKPAAPTTQPARVNPDDMLKQLLSPSRPQLAPIQPEPDVTSVNDMTRPGKVVARGADQQNLIREGTILHERVCRLTRTAENQAELTFDSDGQSLKDPPMIILPNLNLSSMEKAIANTSRDLKFRVTGMITEYGNRNYILLEKVVVVPDESVPPNKRQTKQNDDLGRTK